MADPIFPAGFVVLSFDRPEGERFAIFGHRDWLPSMSPTEWGSPASVKENMEQFVRSLELLPEDALSTRLREMGVATEAAALYIRRARNIREMNKGGSWERVTDVGYRNEEGQIVVARTVRTGQEPGHRVFVMRCSVCGHEYGTHGSEIPHRTCPNCQDGPPGLPL
jgi:hypothetical protein